MGTRCAVSIVASLCSLNFFFYGASGVFGSSSSELRVDFIEGSVKSLFLQVWIPTSVRIFDGVVGIVRLCWWCRIDFDERVTTYLNLSSCRLRESTS